MGRFWGEGDSIDYGRWSLADWPSGDCHAQAPRPFGLPSLSLKAHNFRSFEPVDHFTFSLNDHKHSKIRTWQPASPLSSPLTSRTFPYSYRE